MNIVITGATRGLGRALVDAFCAAGHSVFGCGRSAAHCAEMNSEFGPPHDFYPVDVANDEQVGQWATRAPPADLLINNAALMNTPAVLWEVPAREFDALVDVNIKGVANVIRHFVPPMVHRGRGVIVNLSSGWGRSTSPQVAPYCATKFAIEGLTQALAQELPKGMAAVALNPGVIDTDMLRRAWDEAAGSYPKPERWARSAAPFLLTLNASHNGQSLNVPSQ